MSESYGAYPDRDGKSTRADAEGAGTTPKRAGRGRPLEDAPRTWTDMWAVCRHHHGLTWQEFQSITLAQFEALEDRRVVESRQARFNAALITSTIYNANRSKNSDPLEVWDFIPGFERDQDELDREKERHSVQHGIRVAIAGMRGKTVDQVRAEAKAMVSNLRKNGREDADEIVREVFEEIIRAPYEE